jgi:protein-S-isoprenylcysteine O-methyltransferase
VALCLFVGGLALRWYAIYYLGRFFTVDVAIATDHQVIDSGPYRYLRHPSYTGALLALLGFAITLGQLPAVLVVMLPTTLAFLKRIAVEEAALVAALGERYRRYCAHTRRLVPFVY